jgi:hypothetical protein
VLCLRAARTEVIEGDDEYVYAYSAVRMLAVHNASQEQIKSACRIDPKVLGTDGDLTLRDLVTQDQFRTEAGVLSIDLPPQCTRLLRAE